MSQGFRGLPFEASLAAFSGTAFTNASNNDIMNELSALRDDVKALREALLPPKSILIVGADVERIMKEMIK